MRSHPFVLGNTRAALAAAGVFLMLNGLDLTAPQPVAPVAVRDLAASELPEEGFATGLRDATLRRRESVEECPAAGTALENSRRLRWAGFREFD